MEFLAVQNELKSQLYKLKVNFKKSPKERVTKQYIDTILQTLETKWIEFEKIHFELIKKKEIITKTEYFEQDTYNEVEQFYLEFKTDLKELLDKKNNKSLTKGTQGEGYSNSLHQTAVKLPKLAIPTFSGLYTEWLSFKDLFKSLIHSNETIDNVQKLHYLKGHLSGEAEQLLRHIPITNDNYEQCWSLLENRYDNKQFLANCILKRFFSLRNIISESSSAIKQLLDCTTDMLHGLANLGVDTKSWDIIVIFIVSQKLDSESRKQWEAKVSEFTSNSSKLPTIDKFKEFLQTRYHSLEFLEPRGSNVKGKYFNNSIDVQRSNNVVQSFHVLQPICAYCKGEHKLCHCKEFSDLEVTIKRNFVQSHGICFNCLGNHHSVKHCRCLTSCQHCKKRHHTLLHSNNVQSAAAEASGEATIQDTTAIIQQVTVAAQGENSLLRNTYFSKGFGQSSLLATALVNVDSKGGNYQLRALIDPGSHISFITEAAVQLLGLKRTAIREQFAGLGGEPNLVSKSTAEVTLHSSLNPDRNIRVKVYVLEKLTALLPPRQLSVTSWPILDHITLADPEYYRPNKIDILLGSDVYGYILRPGFEKFPSGSLLAQDTIFGWILTGSENNQIKSEKYENMVSMHVRVDDLLKSFWEIENEPSLTKKILTEKEQLCEERYNSTTTRDESGRYIVRLPFNSDNPECLKGESKEVALKRFKSLERKLEKDINLKEEYKKTFKEYLKLQHMEPVLDNDKPGVYLPYHAVVREEKTTTKVRIVFDASCKGTNGVSLNDDLIVGPTLQRELRHIVMRWRTNPICLTADIVKMYRQILIHEDDRKYQRILWRDNPNDNIVEYQMARVTFGLSSAPYLAVKTLMRLAIDEGEMNQLAAERVKQDFYMDDVMTGCQNEAEAIEIFKQMTNLLNAGGFILQKWYSNNDTVMGIIRNEENDELAGKNIDNKKLEEKAENKNKILGLTWNRQHDEFEYAVQLPPMSPPVTKRKVLSDISRLYDPLGWIAPSVISAKIFIQKLWLSGIEWDEELPQGLLEEWATYRQGLEQLTNFHLPRWTMSSNTDKLVELQGFCDASNAAYGAVVYMRVVDAMGNIHVSLLTAKTRVAPIKQVSIPRLELCGAVLLAKLLVEVSEVLNIPKDNLHAWTDSEVVLAWLSSHPNRWKTFIGNRVTEIILLIDRSRWAHVQSESNPADCASRGVKPSEIANHQLWLNGPTWLKEENIQYINPKIRNTNLEEKTTKAVHVAIAEESGDEIWERFSSLARLLKVVAYCRRILKRKEKNFTNTYLMREEIDEARYVMIRKSQIHSFKEEIMTIKMGNKIKKKSRLISLTPFLDELGILRVGGRIQWADVNEDWKHPILIPHDSHLAKLLVADAHIKTLHGGPQLMLNYLRSKYWIIGAKSLVKHHFKKCVTCIRYATNQKNQLMGQLPQPRVTANRAFLFSGVDYAGPINMRISKGRGNKSYKGYICLFICMSTKAVHLEAVSDLSSQGFLSAFKRFVARRGHCSDLYSDNGSNFIGAARELKELFNEEKSKFIPEISSWLATNNTQWHFIPPHSPNFGGLWEAGIKSTKYHLKRVIGNSTLTFEEMTTLLAQIEACLNSRPISYVEDPHEPMPLTPGHFLVGEALVLPPDRNYEHSTISSLRRWQLCQRMVQDFWRRWSQEHLARLMQRHKWSQVTPEPNVGDIVLIKEHDLPPAQWLMGKITEKHPGVDNITRVVTLQSKNSLIKRPISKLCVLPIAE